MPRKKNAVRICQYCHKEFKTYQNEINRGKSKYCSISCGVAFRNKSIALPPQKIFLKNISREGHPNGCWIYKVGKRYGKIQVGSKTVSAHRFSYEFHFGPIPDKAYVCHKCDVTQCVNPEHLWLGTSKDNKQDMLKKNRGNFPRGSKHHNSQLNELQVAEIKYRLFKYEGVTKLAKEFNVSRCLIDQIRSGRSWIHVVPLNKKEP